MSPARIAASLGACLFVLSAAAEPLSEAALVEARALRERALVDDTAYELVRSLTTEVGSRTPHTEAQRYSAGVPPIPAFAVSNPDADMLEQQLASGLPVRLRVASTSRWDGDAQSANVIGEIPGHERKDEVILLGAHLDSWDLGTGAHDDATGVGIIAAAAKLIGESKRRPRRTVRVVFYANEEFGLSGAKAYAATRGDSIDQHVLGLESDLGAFRPYGFRARVAPDRLPMVRSIQSVLEPLGIAYHGTEASGGADVGQLRDLGLPVADIVTDAAPYFDLHHTANDTFDKVDPALVRLNVAAFAATAYLAAEAEDGFGRLPVASKPAQ